MTPTAQPPETLTHESEFERGKHHAAMLDERSRMDCYRRWHRTSEHPFSRGFRAFVMRTARP